MKPIRLMAVALPFLLLLLAWPAAHAKVSGPFEVLTPDGEVALVDGELADEFWDEWWKSYNQPGGLSWNSPTEAAELHQGVYNAAHRDEGEHPTGWLLRPTEFAEDGWDDAYVFYPATETTPAYIVDLGGTGSKKARWDLWMEATPRMEAIVLAAKPVTPDDSDLGWLFFIFIGAVGGSLATRAYLSRRAGARAARSVIASS